MIKCIAQEKHTVFVILILRTFIKTHLKKHGFFSSYLGHGVVKIDITKANTNKITLQKNPKTFWFGTLPENILTCFHRWKKK